VRRTIGRIAAGLLALAGLVQLGQAGWIGAKAWLAAGLIESAWQATLVSGTPTRPWPWADTWPVGRLQVPGRGVERLVLHGASGRTLAFGPAWDSASEPPGAAGVVLLDGHRDTHFRFLADLAPGEPLRLVGLDGTRDYVVDATRVIDVRHDRLVDPGAVDALLLVTCYPFDTLRTGGPLRYVVTARRADVSAEAT
jgi:sortase A